MRGLARALFYVALPLALVTTNVRFAFSEARVYQYSIDHYDVPTVTGISRSDLIAATNDIRAYFTNSEDYLRTKVHDDAGQVVPLFNPREVLHMHDVKTLVHRVYALQVFALLYVAAYVVAVFLWAREENLLALARRALQACTGAGIVLIALGALIFTGFDAAFTEFHELSFGNSYWQLDPARDHLIQMFPAGFWQDATLLIAGLTAFELVLIALGSLLYLRRARGSAATATPSAAGAAGEPEQADRSDDVPQPVS